MAPIQLNRRTVVVIGILLVAVIAVVVVLLVDRPKSNEDDRGGDPVALLRSENNDSSTTRTQSSAPVPSNSTSSRRGAPSSYPSSIPSDFPSDFATDFPTSAPSTPLELFVEANPVPNNPPSTYFNYDENDSDYGPDEWGKVDTSDSFMIEFSEEGFGAWMGHLNDRDVTKNRCDPSARDKQSPLDLRQSDESAAVCDALHQIRTKVRAERMAYSLV